MTDRTVIVGAGAAGDAVAFGLRKNGFSGSVLLITTEAIRSYERPYLSKQFLRKEMPVEKVFLRPEDAYETEAIELRLDTRAIGGSLEKRRLELDGGETVEWDHLVLATGAEPRWLPDVPRVENVLTLRTLEDSLRLRQELDSASSLLVVGAGFIGAEIAASAKQMGKSVTMIEAAPVPLARALGEEMGRRYAVMHRSQGVDLRTSTTVAEWRVANDRVTGVKLSNGSELPVEVAVVGVGVEPRLDLPRALGLEIELGGVRVDDSLRAAAGVYAAGDIATHYHPVYQRPLRVEHWQVAQRQGTAIARSIVQGASSFNELPWFWSDQYDVNLQYLGHAGQDDRPVTRGDLGSEKFSVFYMRPEGSIDAVLSVNDGRTGRFSRELISARAVVPTDTLSNPDTDMRQLARSPA